MRKLKLNIPLKKLTPVFLISLSLTAIFIIWGAFTPDNLDSVSSSIQSFLQIRFGWFYLLSASAILLFVIYLAISKFGHIKLGKEDDEPEYSTNDWIALFFRSGVC